MEEHPIHDMLQTAMDSLEGILDADSIVGTPIETSDGTVVIPICKASIGFVTGGSEFGNPMLMALPFGGGVVGSVTMTPAAFLIIGKTGIQTVSLETPKDIYSRIIEHTPQMLDKIKSLLTADSSKQQ